MSDIPQLEQALVEAARRRSRRHFAFPVRRVGIALAAAAVIAVLVLVVRSAGGGDEQAATPPPPPPDVQELVGRTFTQAQSERSCQMDSQKQRMIDAPASAATLAAFGVLRGPAGPGSRYPDGGGAPVGGDILTDTVRRIAAADGTPYLIAVTRGPFAARPRDLPACRARQREIFDGLAVGISAEERQRGHELLDEGRPPDEAERSGEEFLELFVLNPDGTPNDGATLTAAEAVRDGLLRPSAKGGGSRAMERAVGGVVPDGVAEVEVAWDGGEARARVRDNAVHVLLPAGAPREVEVIWRDAGGDEIRRRPFRFEL